MIRIELQDLLNNLVWTHWRGAFYRRKLADEKWVTRALCWQKDLLAEKGEARRESPCVVLARALFLPDIFLPVFGGWKAVGAARECWQKDLLTEKSEASGESP